MEKNFGEDLPWRYGWISEVVDHSSANPSLALDDNYYPHISYSKDGEIRYAYQDISGWHIEIVGSGDKPSLALDNHGYAHISYSTSDDPNYAMRDALGWSIEAAPYAGVLSLDNSDFSHVIDFIYPDGLAYAHRDATGWTSYYVDGGWYYGIAYDMAIDGSSRPHISYLVCEEYFHDPRYPR